MSRLQEVADQERAMDTIVNLTGVFEGLASMKIAQVKNQVLSSQQFFSELWDIYKQIRVDSLFRFGRGSEKDMIHKQLVMVITAEGGFSGDIDQKLIKWMLETYDPVKQDIIVIGHHGALQLLQQKVGFKKYFTLPSRDTNINVRPLVQEVGHYEGTTVYYQTYVSLMTQEIKRIELQTAVAEQAQAAGSDKPEEIISDANYIFEPSTFDVVAHLERSMTEIALSQVILDSKLAQYASRFRAMSMAKDKSNELATDLRMLYNRTKRRIQDERLKEMTNGLRMGGKS
ncbi:MAG TPA: F0F1 ATP synthase subunit gamma [Candidatus Pristimantibacillus sp.]|jgi:F-type H+-transporting ATPase subunit gamma|nr:F0F1 ATP synthase subunit gamma [Candidatus Pristimantibacillus sp.]